MNANTSISGMPIGLVYSTGAADDGVMAQQRMPSSDQVVTPQRKIGICS